MVAFICLIFPPILAVWFYEILTKQSLNPKKWVYRFALNAVAINFVIFMVKKFILKTGMAPMYSATQDMTPDAAFNFLIMALPIAAVLVAIQVLFSKKAKLTIEEEDE